MQQRVTTFTSGSVSAAASSDNTYIDPGALLDNRIAGGEISARMGMTVFQSNPVHTGSNFVA